MAKAVWNGKVVAESETYETVEGNVYFPESAVNREYLRPSSTTSTCPWKGLARYYSLMIDGQENPLSILNAAKLYEVTEQVVLTSHMIQPVFFSMAKPVWDKLASDQQKVVGAAAVLAAKTNDENRLADEATVAEALKGKGLVVEKIDLAPFRALADKVYADSDLAKAWDAAKLKQVMEMN